MGENLDLEFEPLDKDNINDIKLFDSGNIVLDDYFKKEAINDTTSKTFIVSGKLNGTKEVVGLYTLCCSGYIIYSQGKYYIYPAVEIKYFAIDKKYQDVLYSEDPGDECLSGLILSMINVFY